jgi:hypothetical protein
MRRAAQLIATLAATALAAGCGSAHAARVGSNKTSSGGVAGAGGSCGLSYTAGHVPVVLKVGTGAVPCAQAKQVESGYNQDIVSGKARGNGGGGQVQVNGWTCEGFPTPRILQTGEVSRCSSGDGQFDAVLASSSPAPSPT